MVRADEMLRRFVCVAPVAELPIGVAELPYLDHALAMAAAVGHEGVGSHGRVGLVLVPAVAADALSIRGENLVAPARVAAWLHEPVNDHQPIAGLAEARRLIKK